VIIFFDKNDDTSKILLFLTNYYNLLLLELN